MGEHGKGLEARPGDRGDADCKKGVSGVAGTKSPAMPPKLKSELSEGYDEAPNKGWGGNVRR